MHERPSVAIEKLLYEVPICVFKRLAQILRVVADDAVPQIPVFDVVKFVALREIDILLVIHQADESGYAFAILINTCGRITDEILKNVLRRVAMWNVEKYKIA